MGEEDHLALGYGELEQRTTDRGGFVALLDVALDCAGRQKEAERLAGLAAILVAPDPAHHIKAAVSPES